MELSPDQTEAYVNVLNWFFAKTKKRLLTLGGFAGTGKTTLIAHLKQELDRVSSGKVKIAFCSYTGRAAQNLKNKLHDLKVLAPLDSVSTIHSLIYKPIENTAGEIVGWAKKDALEYDLIIVDEASMVTELIARDLLYYGIPVLAVGDHGQLPPIQSNFNLMQDPILKLETIHRQAQNSPIIDVSILARNSGEIPAKKYGQKVVKYSSGDIGFAEASADHLENYSVNTLILCGYNSTRSKINQFVRQNLGFESPEPQVGDRVICLRNNPKKGIYNGMLGTIADISYTSSEVYDTIIKLDDLDLLYSGKVYAKQFGTETPINFTPNRPKAKDMDLFDFGYALTVHKAQGSQAQKVVLFEERFSKTTDEDWKRWLYTAVTRAESELVIFGK